MKLTRAVFGLAPVTELTGSPPLKMVSVGTDITRYARVVSGFSSMLTCTISTRSPISLAISASSGSTFLHGAHHSAQKSTSTSLSDCSTSLVKVASVTALPAPTGSSLATKLAELQLDERCDEALGGQRRGTTGAGGGDGLTIGVVDEIAGREHARHV